MTAGSWLKMVRASSVLLALIDPAAVARRVSHPLTAGMVATMTSNVSGWMSCGMIEHGGRKLVQVGVGTKSVSSSRPAVEMAGVREQLLRTEQALGILTRTASVRTDSKACEIQAAHSETEGSGKASCRQRLNHQHQHRSSSATSATAAAIAVKAVRRAGHRGLRNLLECRPKQLTGKRRRLAAMKKRMQLVGSLKLWAKTSEQ